MVYSLVLSAYHFSVADSAELTLEPDSVSECKFDNIFTVSNLPISALPLTVIPLCSVS